MQNTGVMAHMINTFSFLPRNPSLRIKRLCVFKLHENASWGRDADGVEELRMPQGELDQLPDLRQLALATPDVIVTDLVETLVIVALSRKHKRESSPTSNSNKTSQPRNFNAAKNVQTCWRTELFSSSHTPTL